MMITNDQTASPAGDNQTAMVTHQQYPLAPSVIQQLPHQVLPSGFNSQYWPCGTLMLQQQSYSTTRHTDDDRGQRCTRSGKQYYYDSHRNTDDDRSTHTVTGGYRYGNQGRRPATAQHRFVRVVIELRWLKIRHCVRK
eukprot:2224-Heterococcus_DN1.PRE.2